MAELVILHRKRNTIGGNWNQNNDFNRSKDMHGEKWIVARTRVPSASDKWSR